MAMALLFIASLPISAFADYYLDYGNVTVTAEVTGSGEAATTTQTVTYFAEQGGDQKTDTGVSNPVITQSDSTESTSNTVTITANDGATASVTIKNVSIGVKSSDNVENAAVKIEAGNGAAASVTLDNVQIQVSKDTVAAISTDGAGRVLVDLDHENKVQSGYGRAGVDKNGSGSLTIDDTKKDGGSLDATGGDYSAGIGGGKATNGNARDVSGDITIQGGTVTGNGNNGGAGIGGGAGGSIDTVQITGGEVYGYGNYGGAGIGGGSNGSASNISITGGEVTSNGTEGGAGIGGGAGGNATTVSIKDAKVTAVGLEGGAGIGGGYNGELKNPVMISGDADVTSKAMSGVANGAAIGNGGKWDGENIDGEEKAPNTENLSPKGIVKLNVNGKITTIPETKEESKTARPAANPAENSYSVVDKDGKSISYKTEVKDGVLTVTVDGDYAVLTGTAANIAALTAQGVTTVVFVTSGATSTFDLADLSAKGSGTYKLTHDGATVTFTLDATDISEILK